MQLTALRAFHFVKVCRVASFVRAMQLQRASGSACVLKLMERASSEGSKMLPIKRVAGVAFEHQKDHVLRTFWTRRVRRTALLSQCEW